MSPISEQNRQPGNSRSLTPPLHQPSLPPQIRFTLQPSMTSTRSITKTRSLLENAARELRVVLQDESIMPETPIEAQTAMESATEAIAAALSEFESIAPKRGPSTAISGGPTRQQGQFLAFIREFMLRNEAGLAPTHAELQRFFNLTAPSVNSMLIRLEQRGFIRRIPGQARAIQLSINPDQIPPLDRPLKFGAF